MNYKFVIPVIIELLKNGMDVSASMEESKKMFVQTIRVEALSVLIKTMIGIVFVGVTIFSLISVGQQANVMILAQDNGPMISMILFGTLAASSIAALVFLFNRKAGSAAETATAPLVDVQKVLKAFIEGLDEGFKRDEQKVNSNDKQTHERPTASREDLSTTSQRYPSP